MPAALVPGCYRYARYAALAMSVSIRHVMVEETPLKSRTDRRDDETWLAILEAALTKDKSHLGVPKALAVPCG